MNTPKFILIIQCGYRQVYKNAFLFSILSYIRFMENLSFDDHPYAWINNDTSGDTHFKNKRRNVSQPSCDETGLIIENYM